MPVGVLSVYSRATFDIADVAQVQDIWIGADFDDGWMAWINGIEVYRSPEMLSAPEPPAWNADPASHESSNGLVPDYGQMVDISSTILSQLKNGTNVLAVGVWNRIPSMPPSSDLVLVPKLAINREAAVSYLASLPG